MTVAQTNARTTVDYVGVNSFPFLQVQDDDDVKLFVVDPDDELIETPLTKGVHYTVALDSNKIATSTLTQAGINFVTAYGACRISQLRVPQLTQTTLYVEGSKFPAKSHEGGLDKLTFIAQWLYDQILRNKGINGAPGRELEMREDMAVLQWRYVGSADWMDLFDLTILEGDPGAPGQNGRSVELGIDGTVLQWRLIGDVPWIDIIDIQPLIDDAVGISENQIVEFAAPSTVLAGDVTMVYSTKDKIILDDSTFAMWAGTATASAGVVDMSVHVMGAGDNPLSTNPLVRFPVAHISKGAGTMLAFTLDPAVQFPLPIENQVVIVTRGPNHGALGAIANLRFRRD